MWTVYERYEYSSHITADGFSVKLQADSRTISVAFMQWVFWYTEHVRP